MKSLPSPRFVVAKGYLVVDACIHTEPYRRAEKDFDYKLYIMELAMEWVEEKCRVELSRSKCHTFLASLIAEETEKAVAI